MKKWCFPSVLFLLLCALMPAQAQWEEPPGQYWAVKGYFNPSFAGDREAVSAAALYRNAWSGIGNAPRQLFLTANMPFEALGKRHGAGLAVYNETAGGFRNSLLAAQYSFKKEVAGGFLNVGLQAGVYDLKFDAGSKSVFVDSLQQGRSMMRVNPADKQVIDLGAGISWTGKSLFIGLSANHLTRPRFYARDDSLATGLQSDSTLSAIPRSYNLMAGYNIIPFHPLEIQPMLWVHTDFSTLQVQATLRLEYDGKFSGGASWRVDDGYLLFVGTIIREIELGYAYGSHSKATGQDNRASHEIYLRYHFPLDYFKPKRQPHKSIRLL